MTALLSLALLVQSEPRQIDDLIRDLGDDLIEVREKAQRALTQIGASAIPALRKAVASDDPERALRARAVWLRFDRGERQREHDAKELAALLEENRPPDLEKPGGRRWSALTEGARFALGAVPRDGGLVIYTEFEPFLYRYDRLCQRKGDVRFDIEKACTLEGREIPLVRCARRSPRMVLAKDHDGPMRIRVRGVQTWFSRYEVEFSEPKMGQSQLVGDMPIEVAWPRIKVTSMGGFPEDSYRPPQHRFEFDMKPGAQRRMPMQSIGGIGFG
ncbi:MAG TPA: HEAT repeat domain-containing protein [Planctomycetota bacterium]|nr:HEAT repeat domain-containing protein [Planctomycetota bacterium]